MVTPSLAATTSWEGFDLKNCKHWSMTPDDFIGSGENFDKASELANKLNSTDKDHYWLVVRGRALYEEGDILYGVCSFPSSSVITCAKGVEFPLSGMTYRLMSSKGKLQNYQCSENCGSAEVQTIHDMGYERGAEDVNIEHGQLQSQFELKCHENERAEKFFK